MKYPAIDQSLDSLEIIVNQALGSPENNTDQRSRHLPLIFDTEVFQDIDVDSHDKMIEHTFSDNLRPFKNHIFFDNITDRTKELFK